MALVKKNTIVARVETPETSDCRNMTDFWFVQLNVALHADIPVYCDR
jgi:hypothetical protein